MGPRDDRDSMRAYRRWRRPGRVHADRVRVCSRRSKQLAAGYIKSIGVPEFINQSTTPDIDRVLTEAVRQEFQSKGRYQVQPEAAGVDAVLTGTVTSVVLMPVQFTADRQVSSYSIVVTANVEFKDLTTGKVLWSNPGFRVTDEYQVTTGTTPNDPQCAVYSGCGRADASLACVRPADGDVGLRGVLTSCRRSLSPR